jgi:predicted RNase H-like HicB family nuclease
MLLPYERVAKDAGVEREGVQGMVQYKAGNKFVDGGVHAQVLDFPAATSCGGDLDDARRMLGLALIDMAETLLELGQPLPRPNPAASDPEMDLEEPIFMDLSVASNAAQEQAGEVTGHPSSFCCFNHLKWGRR